MRTYKKPCQLEIDNLIALEIKLTNLADEYPHFITTKIISIKKEANLYQFQLKNFDYPITVDNNKDYLLQILANN